MGTMKYEDGEITLIHDSDDYDHLSVTSTSSATFRPDHTMEFDLDSAVLNGDGVYVLA